MIKKVAFVITMIVSTVIGYCFGYNGNYQNNLSKEYDFIHLNLTGELMIYDAIVNGNGELATPIILSMISSDFVKLIELYNIGQKEKSELVRCAVTRKLRVLKDKGIVFSGEKATNDWGDKLEVVNKYLLTECLGEPSHSDWSEPDRKHKESLLLKNSS